MLESLILALASLFQLAALYYSLRIWRVTRWHFPWLLVFLANVSIVLQLVIPYFQIPESHSESYITFDVIGLATSLLLAFGLKRIAQLFESKKYTQQALHANQIKDMEAENNLQDLNEQLNCTNEKLTSANEELNAINEELVVTNDELLATNEALRKSENKLREAQDLAQLGYWCWDVKTGNVEWSEQVYKIFQLEPNEFVPRIDSILALSPWPEDIDRDKELIQRTIADHGQGRYEQRSRRPDNSTGYYYSTFQGTYDEEGNVVSISGTVQDITERKLAEEVLMASEQKYRELFENAPVGIFRTNSYGEVLSVNPTMTRFLGLTSQADTSERFMDLATKLYVRPGKRDDFLRLLREIGSVENYEYEAFTADGSIIWLSMNARIAQYINDDNFIIEGFATDITERKLTENALLKSETKYRQLIEMANEGVWVDDRDSITTFVNSQMASMLGCTPEDIVGHINTEFMFVEDLVLGDEGQLVQRHEIGDARRRGERSSYEQRFRRSDGTELWCMVSGTPIIGEDGEYLGSFGMFTDITERRYAERTLMASEVRYRRLFESAKDGILILDAETGVVDDVNPYLANILGYSFDQLKGKPVWELEFFKDFVQSFEHFTILRQQEFLRYDDLSLETAYGRRIDVEFVSIVYQANQRKVIQCNIRDISERKRIEMERAALEEELRQVHKMEAIGTLAGGIAHDFNNLLFAILGNAELAREEVDSRSQAYSNIQALIAAGNRAKGLVQQILAFSRKTQQEPILLEIINIVKEVLKMLRATLPSTLEIRQRIEPVSALVMADPTEIHQVLMNLCTNAASAMAPGPGVLEISLRETELRQDSTPLMSGLAPGYYIELGVSDTGHGIPPEIQSRIFEPFFTTRETGKGTGLGLSVVHGIVSKLGGAIVLDSKVGVGTHFTVYLPAQRGTLRSADLEDAQFPRGSAHILIVDDESSVLAVERQMLESLGYEVTCCASAVEALALHRQDPQRFDALLTDQTMPRQTGIELAREMLRLRSDLPVILCTGYSEAVTPETTLAFGIKECLYKPVNKRELADALYRVLHDVDRAQA
jgi:PAS domain S-box-containing protein